MKYNEQQAYKVKQRKQNIQCLVLAKLERIRKDFPVYVEIKDGYYIVESKMNN